MKTFRYIFLICLVLFITNSIANAQTKFEKKKVGHIYYLNVPDYMSKTKQLNDAASLQYQNIIRKAYVIVIEDSKEELESVGAKFTSPDDFYKDFIDTFSTKINNPKAGKPYSVNVHGYNAVQGELTASIESSDIFYLITVVETKEYFYKIMCWTVLENKDKLMDDFIKISSSLRE
ncbi:MAG: hypothetical protein ABSG15_15900 [FCB group bacterium]